MRNTSYMAGWLDAFQGEHPNIFLLSDVDYTAGYSKASICKNTISESRDFHLMRLSELSKSYGCDRTTARDRAYFTIEFSISSGFDENFDAVY